MDECTVSCEIKLCESENYLCINLFMLLRKGEVLEKEREEEVGVCSPLFEKGWLPYQMVRTNEKLTKFILLLLLSFESNNLIHVSPLLPFFYSKTEQAGKYKNPNNKRCIRACLALFIT